jgi:REP element-mobilizing transposase RayT
MPRQARLDTPGTLHHVMIRGIERKAIVRDHADRKEFIDRMGRLALESKSAIYAWAMMTNHVHILLRSGPKGLPGFMRRLLTGYAITFNRRHRRHGHLFQNRYKSIICDEETYFRELVRYIHLNPLRANLVQTITSLDKYPWCGHATLMGRINQEWHHSDYVLSWFGKSAGVARRAYRDYVIEGISMGRRPDLVGGGLIRSQGGWSQVISMRRRKEHELYDERILGPGDFVERVIEEAEENIKRALRNNLSNQNMEQLILKTCRESGISVEELKKGGRRADVSQVRLKLASDLVKKHGLSMAKTARHLGVSTPAISHLLRRMKEIKVS